MALTRDFKETIQARARRDARFRQALFTEAINAYLAANRPREFTVVTVGPQSLQV